MNSTRLKLILTLPIVVLSLVQPYCSVLLAASDSDRRKYISKVSDFGLSRVLQNNKNHSKTQTFGTVTHVPPELLSKGTLTTKADVYAIGVLMWEIYTAEKVFKQLSDSEVILAVVTKKARPVFPSDVPSRFKFLAGQIISPS